MVWRASVNRPYGRGGGKHAIAKSALKGPRLTVDAAKKRLNQAPHLPLLQEGLKAKTTKPRATGTRVPEPGGRLQSLYEVVSSTGPHAFAEKGSV